MTTNDALLSVENLVVEYPVGRGRKVHAVSDVSFDVQAGETLGVVGRPARPSSSSRGRRRGRCSSKGPTS